MKYFILFIYLLFLPTKASAIKGCVVDNIDKEIDDSKFHAGCLIVDKDLNVLMSINKNGKFSIPGGTRNPSENPYHVACREVQEEVGAVPKIHNVFKIYNKSGMDDNFVLFSCSLNEKVKSDHKFEDEIIGNKWVKINEVRDESLRRPQEYRDLYKEVLIEIQKKKFPLSN